MAELAWNAMFAVPGIALLVVARLRGRRSEADAERAATRTGR